MTPHTERQHRAWMAQWRAAGPVLEQIRLQELAVADLGRIASALEDACLAAVRAADPARLSGLVEQQRILHSRACRVRTLLEAGGRLQRALDDLGWRFCFIGGVANFRWGTPRLTSDLDLTLLTGFGREAEFAARLLAEFERRIADPMDFAAKYRVLLLRTADGFAMDIALGAMPFEERTIERSSPVELVPGATLRTCSAEDLSC